MAMQNVCEFLRRWKAIVAGLTLVFAMTAVTSIPADARRHHGSRHAGYHQRHHGFHHRHHVSRHTYFRRHVHHHGVRYASVHGDAGSPRFAAIVVDANSGRTLYARNENELRHPASVTKVMTLYLLFEQLEKGRIRLNSPLTISAHAAAQAPSKLGLRPGETIEVESAIKAVVTKSANDIAVAIAENVAGDEKSFAELMTRKAHALGMSRTRYVNASGLPNDEQITTARDLVILGRAIQDRFPKYYRYFSTHVFAYHGARHRNHNHLLGQIEGVDGIKTGYTRSSGFNLLTSVRRDGHHIVAVVLGGRTAAYRDRIMAGLIEDHIGNGSTSHTARTITEDVMPEERPARTAVGSSQSNGDTQHETEAPASIESTQTIEPAPLAYFSPEPISAPSPIHNETVRDGKIRPAFVPGGRAAALEQSKPRHARHVDVAVRTGASVDGSTARVSGRSPKSETVTTPSALTVSSISKRAEPDGRRTLLAKAEVGKTDVLRKDVANTQVGRPARAGWMVQIGATEDVREAAELLAKARGVHGPLASAKAFTEKVQKGKDTLWRARFAGLEEQDAEAACKSLKRSGFACFATKN